MGAASTTLPAAESHPLTCRFLLQTPLYLSVESGHKNIALFLASKGAKLDVSPLLKRELRILAADKSKTDDW